MSADERQRILATWKALPELAEERDRDWDDEPPGYILHYFRPHGVGLNGIVAGMDHAEDVLERLRQVFEATRNGDPRDMYFIVRKPPRLRANELESLARRHLANMIKMATLLSEQDEVFAERCAEDLAALSGSDVSVEVLPGPPPTEGHKDVHPLRSFLYETTTSFGHLFPPASEHANLLEDPCYMLACSYELAHYVLWPTRSTGCPIDEPFAPYFEMWRHGASVYFQDDFREWRFEDDRVVRVNVPALAA